MPFCCPIISTQFSRLFFMSRITKHSWTWRHIPHVAISWRTGCFRSSDYIFSRGVDGLVSYIISWSTMSQVIIIPLIKEMYFLWSKWGIYAHEETILASVLMYVCCYHFCRTKYVLTADQCKYVQPSKYPNYSFFSVCS